MLFHRGWHAETRKLLPMRAKWRFRTQRVKQTRLCCELALMAMRVFGQNKYG